MCVCERERRGGGSLVADGLRRAAARGQPSLPHPREGGWRRRKARSSHLHCFFTAFEPTLLERFTHEPCKRTRVRARTHKHTQRKDTNKGVPPSGRAMGGRRGGDGDGKTLHTGLGRDPMRLTRDPCGGEGDGAGTKPPACTQALSCAHKHSRVHTSTLVCTQASGGGTPAAPLPSGRTARGL